MERDIKFRAYNGKEKTMLVQSNAMDENRAEFWRKWETTSHISYPMQYTGLKDKNGKEIYEGDICSNQVATWEVIFNKGCFCGKRINGSDGTQEIHLALRAIVGLEIIGNIHENPELLTTKQ